MAEENKTGLIDMPDLDTSETCYNLYQSFYSSIKTAQDNNPNISLDVRIMNAAYSLAAPIANMAATSEPNEAHLATFVQKAGDQMSGSLDALYGFRCGIEGLPLMSTKKETDENGNTTATFLDVSGKLKIAGSHLYIDGTNIFSCGKDSGIGPYILNIDNIDLTRMNSSLVAVGEYLCLTNDSGDILYADDSSFSYMGKKVWYAGNSNKTDVDWSMKNATVSGTLSTGSNATVGGIFSALHGAQIGYDGSALMVVQSADKVELTADLYLQKANSIAINGVKIITNPSDFHLQLNSIGGDLILGGDTTNVIRLWDTLTTEAGDHNLIDKFGNAEFMNTIKIGYGFGNVLMTTTSDSVLIKEKLRFDNEQGTTLSYIQSGLLMGTLYDNGTNNVSHSISWKIGNSSSIYADQSRNSETAILDTSADFIRAGKPIEATGFIGIVEQPTRLTKDTLFFNDSANLVALADGIKHYGHSYFDGNLSSVRFSSGFAGYGWSIRKATGTGNVEITADELVIRKKMRVYELEIQKISAVNGSLWVSDSCKGDKVTLIN